MSPLGEIHTLMAADSPAAPGHTALHARVALGLCRAACHGVWPCRAVGARLCLASLVGTHPRPRRRPGAEAHAASTILCRLRRARSQVKFLSGVSTLQSGSADRFIPAYLERLCGYLLRAGEGLRGISSPSSWERLVPRSAGSSAARKPPSAFHPELVTSLRRVPQRGESQPKLSQR